MKPMATCARTALADMIQNELPRRGRSVRWLAHQIGVSPQTANNLGHGIRPHLTTLCKLSPFLEQPPSSLIRLTGLAPQDQFGPEEDCDCLTGDWPSSRVLGVMRQLPYEGRKRILRLVELFAEGQAEGFGLQAPIATRCTEIRSQQRKEILT